MMHTYSDPNKQAIVTRAQDAINKAQSIIDDMKSRRVVVPVAPKFNWDVRIKDLSPEEQAKVVRMSNKAR